MICLAGITAGYGNASSSFPLTSLMLYFFIFRAVSLSHALPLSWSLHLPLLYPISYSILCSLPREGSSPSVRITKQERWCLLFLSINLSCALFLPLPCSLPCSFPLPLPLPYYRSHTPYRALSLSQGATVIRAATRGRDGPKLYQGYSTEFPFFSKTFLYIVH